MKEITQETINKISETKLETGRKNIIEGFIKNDIQKQSDIKLAIPSHRTSKWISFEEFKTLISNGKSLKELSKLYSKHLMAFYSSLSQGKITLTKEQFVEEYENGIPLDEIGRSHNIPREHITYLREYYGIKRKGATFQKRLKNEVPLSQEAKDVIIGSLLGDGHITPLGYFSEKHSEKQVEYLEWKASFLKPIMTLKSFDAYKSFDKRYGSTNYSFCLRTTAHSFLYEMRNKFYKEVNGKTIKIIPDDIESILNERVLAIWFMDDGHTDWMYRNGKEKYNMAPQSKISSQSFSKKENEKLQISIFNKFNITSSIKPRDNNLFYLQFNGENSEKLLSLTKIYTTSCTMYKFSKANYVDTINKQIKNEDKETLMSNFIIKHNIFKKR